MRPKRSAFSDALDVPLTTLARKRLANCNVYTYLSRLGTGIEIDLVSREGTMISCVCPNVPNSSVEFLNMGAAAVGSLIRKLKIVERERKKRERTIFNNAQNAIVRTASQIQKTKSRQAKLRLMWHLRHEDLRDLEDLPWEMKAALNVHLG